MELGALDFLDFPEALENPVVEALDVDSFEMIQDGTFADSDSVEVFRNSDFDVTQG